MCCRKYLFTNASQHDILQAQQQFQRVLCREKKIFLYCLSIDMVSPGTRTWRNRRGSTTGISWAQLRNNMNSSHVTGYKWWTGITEIRLLHVCFFCIIGKMSRAESEPNQHNHTRVTGVQQLEVIFITHSVLKFYTILPYCTKTTLQIRKCCLMSRWVPIGQNTVLFWPKCWV